MLPVTKIHPPSVFLGGCPRSAMKWRLLAAAGGIQEKGADTTSAVDESDPLYTSLETVDGASLICLNRKRHTLPVAGGTIP